MQKFKKTYIECDCGTHLLQVTHDYEIFNHINSNTKLPRVRQEFDIAMFTYRTYNKKPSLWERLCIIWKYLKTGEMHRDQVILNEDEAKKLANFINDNIIHTFTYDQNT
jgi:hypothetical protein